MPISPHDILYLAIALSVLVFTGFMCWLIFYATQILKSASMIVNEVRDRLLSITSMLGDLASKVERVYDMVSSFSGIGDMIKNKVRSKAASMFAKTSAGEKDNESDRDAEEIVEETVSRSTKKQSRK